MSERWDTGLSWGVLLTLAILLIMAGIWAFVALDNRQITTMADKGMCWNVLSRAYVPCAEAPKP